MSQSYYINQFKKAGIIASQDYSTNPNPNIMTVRFDPTATGQTVSAGEGVLLKDIGASDTNTSGLPIVAKRSVNSDAVFGIKLWNSKYNSALPSDEFAVAQEGAVLFMQALTAINRGQFVGLIVGQPGYVKVSGSGTATIGQSLDKGAAGDIVRILLTNYGAASST